MFDKVDMATNIYIKGAEFEEMLKDELYQIKKFTNIDNDTGEIYNTYIVFDKKIPYIKYNDRSKRLFISLSIPKLIYGNNIKEIDEHDIKDFFIIIHNRLNELFGVCIESTEWKICEVEVSKNFYLDSHQQVTEYINKLSNIKLPRKTTIKYNTESVYFKNKSQIIKFYDKLHQLKKETDITASCLKQAENILRFEVQTKSYRLREFSAERKAIDLLSKKFFDSVTSGVIEIINNKITLEDKNLITPIIFDSGLTKAQIESSVAIMIFTNELGESAIKDVYSTTTLNRKQGYLKNLIHFVQQQQQIEKKLFLK
ncbi:phage/plasmid replication protein [Bacillus sp. FJAT-27251]|uniref:phage/plasmid replication domain-containing protein n=1 Tax=Bacillus sp. FJAT-27251 TaxID=1684142 RepID=UPI0006A77B9B|nr:phage/plasmid replication protein [Bacillus sp. FJAT-27251]